MKWFIPSSRHRAISGFADGIFTSDPSSLGWCDDADGVVIAPALTIPPTPGNWPVAESTDYPVLLEVADIGVLTTTRHPIGNCVVGAVVGAFPASAVRAIHLANDNHVREVRARRFNDVDPSSLPLISSPTLFEPHPWAISLEAAGRGLRSPGGVPLPNFAPLRGLAALLAGLEALQSRDAVRAAAEALEAWEADPAQDPTQAATQIAVALADGTENAGRIAIIVSHLMSETPAAHASGEELAERWAGEAAPGTEWAESISRIGGVVEDPFSEVEISDPSLDRDLQALLLLLLRPSPRGACGRDWPDVDVDDRTLALGGGWSYLLSGRLPAAGAIPARSTQRVCTALANAVNVLAGSDIPMLRAA